MFESSEQQRPSSNNTTKALLDFSHLSQHVQNHLLKVYANMAVTIGFSVLGSYTAIRFPHLVSVPLMIILSIVSLIAIAWSSNPVHRKSFLYAFGLCKGVTLAPLIQHSLAVDPNLVAIALFATALIFVSFSASALLSNKRQYIYLGGMLSSALSLMLFLSIVNMFVQTNALTLVQLYGGLIVFCGYILYDTQMIVEKCKNGMKDDVAHALELYTDFVAVFVRILIILNKNKEKSSKKKK